MENQELIRGGGNKPINNTLCQKMMILICPIILKVKVLKKFFLKSYHLPENMVLSTGFWSNGPNLKVGDNVILGSHFRAFCRWAPIYVGNNTMFSHYNTIITSLHDFNDINIIIGKPVKIGHHCWITTNVTILPGVSIGDHTVIGAGSVVTKDMPSGVFAAGNPCKVIKKIYIKEDDQSNY